MCVFIISLKTSEQLSCLMYLYLVKNTCSVCFHLKRKVCALKLNSLGLPYMLCKDCIDSHD